MTHLPFNDPDKSSPAPSIPRGDVNLSVLPSFPQIRRQNLLTLYGNTKGDKSRAGHVDEHIQDLVNCINRHSSYVTLSSCSGRIAFFDPAATCKSSVIATETTYIRSEEAARIKTANADSDNVGGKGGGGSWLLVSHDAIDSESDLLPFFAPSEVKSRVIQGNPSTIDDLEEERICFLKLEPMLLHVAASNLYHGKLLLQVALQQGFRESGLIVTDHRVTVAIRSNSLSLSIPLSRIFNHPLQPSSAYLKALTMECNRRLRLNLQLLHKLHFAIQQKLFPLELSHSINETFPLPTAKVSMRAALQLPSLNLFGHSMVAIESDTSQFDNDGTELVEGTSSTFPHVTEFLVFGGYGPGPHAPTTAVGTTKPLSRRSSSIYRLIRDRNLEWSAAWEKVETVVSTNEYSISLNLHPFANLQAQPVGWTARQSATALNLSEVLGRNDSRFISGDSGKWHILIYGGRSGPAKPLGELLIYEYSRSSIDSTLGVSTGQVFQPLDIRGAIPSPRWGHSFTSFPSKISSWQHDIPWPIAILIGGRQTESICSDALFLLSLVPSDTTTFGSDAERATIDYYFQWEPLRVGDSNHPAMQRFHHTANWIDDSNVFVFGGLFRPDDLLSAFSLGEDNLQFHDSDLHSSVMLTLRKNDERFVGATVASLDCATLPHRFGHTATSLTTERLTARKGIAPSTSMVLFIGGVVSNSLNADDTSLMECVQLSPRSTSGLWKMDHRELAWKLNNPTIPSSIDFGVLVHHCGMEAETTSQDCRCATKTIVLTGGGVSGFAFQELYANSFVLLIDTDDSLETFEEDNNASSNVGHPLSITSFSTASAKISLGISSSSKETNASTTLSQRCDVVYVLKCHAKQLKTTLEQLQLLNKQYRLSEVDTEGVTQWFHLEERIATNKDETLMKTLMAVPVAAGALNEILSKQKDGAVKSDDDRSWLAIGEIILGYGNQVCLWSTSAFARGGAKWTQG
jgi:tRNA wybutosine-synthesizing protein 3